MSPVKGRERRVSNNPGTATYGAIVVSAAVAAASSDDRPWAVVAKVVATLVVFWLAHVHSAVIEERFNQPDESVVAAIRAALAHELVMLEIAAAPIAFLLAGAAGLFRWELADDLALASGVGELFAIGVLRGRRASYRVPAIMALGAIYAAGGGALVLLKVAIH